MELYGTLVSNGSMRVISTSNGMFSMTDYGVVFAKDFRFPARSVLRLVFTNFEEGTRKFDGCLYIDGALMNWNYVPANNYVEIMIYSGDAELSFPAGFKVFKTTADFISQMDDYTTIKTSASGMTSDKKTDDGTSNVLTPDRVISVHNSEWKKPKKNEKCVLSRLMAWNDTRPVLMRRIDDLSIPRGMIDPNGVLLKVKKQRVIEFFQEMITNKTLANGDVVYISTIAQYIPTLGFEEAKNVFAEMAAMGMMTQHPRYWKGNDYTLKYTIGSI